MTLLLLRIEEAVCALRASRLGVRWLPKIGGGLVGLLTTPVLLYSGPGQAAEPSARPERARPAVVIAADTPLPQSRPSGETSKQKIAPTLNGSSTWTIPNDPHFQRQWQFARTGMTSAWGITTGSPYIRIAILDSGRSSHPDLDDKWVPGLEYDAENESGNATFAAYAHGVHVAGLAGAETNNALGTAGVCPQCELLNVKVGSLASNLYAVARGIRWATANGADIINMSFEDRQQRRPCNSTDEDITALREAVAYAISQNVVVVAAAGNASGTNQGVDATQAPSSCPGVISVAATDQQNNLAVYSNRRSVTLAAPGGASPEGLGDTFACDSSQKLNSSSSAKTDPTRGVFSTWSRSSPTESHCYSYVSGTSMAAPQVAGVVGLMLSRNPSLTPKQVRTLLAKSATPLPNCGPDCGAGLLNAPAAVLSATAPVKRLDRPPVARFNVTCAGLLCTLDARASSDDIGIVAYQWKLPGEAKRSGALKQFYMPGYGQHVVKLRVTDEVGQFHDEVKTTVIAQPNVRPQVGAYWNPQRDGNGIDLFETTDGNWVVTWYTYDSQGRPTWYVSGVGPLAGSRWRQPLLQARRTGGTFGTTTLTQVGEIGLDFSTPTDAWLSWSLDGFTGGERYQYLFGGQGRSGAWHHPGNTGWGYGLQESGGVTTVALTFFEGTEGTPRWAVGSANVKSSVAGSQLTLPLQWFIGRGLCPYCQGTTPKRPDSFTSARGTVTLQITGDASTTGIASTNLISTTFPIPVWTQPASPIQLLTRP